MYSLIVKTKKMETNLDQINDNKPQEGKSYGFWVYLLFLGGLVLIMVALSYVAKLLVG